MNREEFIVRDKKERNARKVILQYIKGYNGWKKSIQKAQDSVRVVLKSEETQEHKSKFVVQLV